MAMPAEKLNDFIQGKYQVMPVLSDEEYAELKADITARGVMVPVEYDEEGNVLDGYNRVQICRELGVKEWPRVIRVGLTEDQKREHARKLNLARRHLNQEQRRELIRQQLAEMPKKSDRQIAVGLGVDHKTIGAARKELESIGEIPQCDRQTSDGRTYPSDRKTPVSIFAPTARAQDKAQQVIVAAKGGSKKAEKLVGKMASGSSTTAAAAKQVAREEHVSLVAPPLPDGVFNVILADPPWQYQFSETESRAIENQYPTMDLDDIKKLQIPSADDSVLFLWATAPKLEEALQVLNAWGFGYRTCAVWDKEVIGMGYWFRNQHELLLVGVKGNFHPPDPEIRISSVIRQKRSEHSRKPECIYGILESMFPQGKFLELFARQNKRPDWMIWGNQLEG